MVALFPPSCTSMGHEVTVFHRGKTTTQLPSDVQHILGDKPPVRLRDRMNLPNFRSEFKRLCPEVVLDMIAYTDADEHI